MVGKRPSRAGNDDAGTAATPIAAGDPDIVPRVRRAVHDLRQPVQAMRLFVHLLDSRLEREEDRALVVKLDEALENIETALRGLMSSVVPGGAKPGETPPTDR
jgi:hypothetical protein